MAFVALTGARLLDPLPALAASGTLSMDTPLHDSPGHGAPVIALLPEGAVVSITGPPIDGFYPVTTGELAGWMRGETILLEKDIPYEEPAASPPPEGMAEAPIEQTASEPATSADAYPPVDPAAAPALTSAPADGSSAAGPSYVAPAPDAASSDPAAVPSEPTSGDPAPADPALTEVVPLDPAAAAPPPTDPSLAAPAPADPAAVPNEMAPEWSADAAAATPVSGAPPSETPVADEWVAPAPEPAVTPIPEPASAPTGPASVTTDAPVFSGPGPAYGLVFTVPGGSTLEQTGQLIDGYVSVQYKEVSGWTALDYLTEPIEIVAETPPAEPAAVDVKTPRPGSGVAYTTVDLSLRAGPSANESPVVAVPAGSRVILTGVMEGNFQRVTYKDQLGWVGNEFLQTPADPDPSGNQQGYSRREIVRIIYAAADQHDQSRSAMLRVAECESNLNPYAVNPSGSYGLFQFIRTTWKSTPYGNEDIFDPEANANAAGWMWSQGRKSEWVCQ
jgi:uncharacterized protein YraI